MSRSWVIVLSIAAMVTAVAGLAIGSFKSGPAELHLPLMLATAAPYAMILVFAYSGAWHRACALAIGTATVAFLGLILFAGVFTLFLGFAMGDKEQIAFVLLLDAFVAIQLPLGAAARMAKRVLPPLVRPRGEWRVAWGLPLAIALGIAVSITGLQNFNQWRVNHVYRNEEVARQALNRVADCLKKRAENGAGFPASLAAIGPDGTKCLDASTAAGKLDGHQLLYWPGAADGTGKVRLYSLCAEVIDFRKSAWRTYVSDESGQMVYVEPHEKSLEPYSCSQAWMGDPVRRVKHCLVAYAAKNGSYPRTLDEVGSGVTGCLTPLPIESTRTASQGFGSVEKVVSYRPAAADVQGRITAFELHGARFVYPLRFNVMIDETGTAYAAKERDATRGDPPPAVFVRQTEEQSAATKKERDALWIQCDGGAVDVCIKLARSEAGGPAWWTTDKYWKRGCEHGSEMSCVFATRQSDPDVFSLAHNDQRDCDAGKPEGCERVRKLARDYRGCNDNEPAGCHGLARRIARAGNTHKANEYWDKGCKGGHAESCYFLQVRDFVYINAMKLAEACDAGDTLQCAKLKQEVARMAGRR